MATKPGDRREGLAWRKAFGDLLIAAGVLILVVGAMFWTRTALASSQVSTYRYLPSNVRPALPLPQLVDADGGLRLGISPSPASPEAGLLPDPNGEQPGPEVPLEGGIASLAEPTPVMSPAAEAAAEPSPTAQPTAPVAAAPTAAATAIVPTAIGALPPTAAPTQVQPAATEAVPAVTEAVQAAPTEAAPVVTEVVPIATEAIASATEPVQPPPTATPVTPTATPKPKPTARPTLPPYSPVVRIVIPNLEVDRAVVPVGLKPGSGGSLEWDTDALFATQNRPDLVGQLVGSYSPGQGGNIILIGHNYNQVDYGWTGVFVDIKTLSKGDQIAVFTEDGRQTNYRVEVIKQVPWRSKSEGELEKHMKYMGSTPRERLTLVTCGGANIWPFPARVYVVALPVR